MELEAWAYALKREELRSRLLENTVELRLAIEAALARISIKRGGKSAERDGLLLETIAMGLVAGARAQRTDQRSAVLDAGAFSRLRASIATGTDPFSIPYLRLRPERQQSNFGPS